jgi:hypothetical protein
MLVGAGLGFETALDSRARPQRRRPGAYAVEKQASAVSPVPSTSRSRLAVLSEWNSPNSAVPNVTEAPELGSRKTCRASARVEAQEKATSTRTTAIESARRNASRLDCMSFHVFRRSPVRRRAHSRRWPAPTVGLLGRALGSRPSHAGWNGRDRAGSACITATRPAVQRSASRTIDQPCSRFRRSQERNIA